MGDLFKRKFCFIFALMFLVVSCSVYAFAKEDDFEEQQFEIGYKEALEQYKKSHNGEFSLDGIVDGSVFDGCYGNQLDETSKCVYDALVSNIEKSKDGTSVIADSKLNEQDVIILKGKTFSELQSEDFASIFYGIAAFDYDYPEVFWIDFNSTNFSLGTYGNKVWVSIKVNSSAGYENYYCDGYSSKEDVDADIQKLENVYKKISTAVENENIYNKVKYFNNYLIDSNEYNRFLGSGTEDDRLWKCVSALIYGSSDQTNTLNPVCEGYSRALKFLCNKEEIECVLVSGMNHMWNYIKMNDGQWYAIDTTWNDPVFSTTPSEEAIEANRYKYFLQGSDKFDIKHTAENNGVMYDKVVGVVYPVLAKSDYVYDPTVFETTTEESSSEESSTDDEDISESSTEESSTENISESPTEDTSESSTENTSDIIFGDVDGNGKIEVNDAVVLLKALLDDVLTDYQIKVGNLDKSNLEITAADVSYILQMALGNI